MDSTPISSYSIYSSTIPVVGGKCRWCGVEDGARDPEAMQCDKCGAIRKPVVTLADSPSFAIRVYHNPDNSLFIEFDNLNSKSMRYILDPAALMKMGLLQIFDNPPDGKK